MIVSKSDGVDQKRKEKIARFCNVKVENVISAPDVPSIYDIPLNYEEDKLSNASLLPLGLKAKSQ